MKTILYTILAAFISFSSWAQKSETEIIIITEDGSYNTDDIEITIKKEGKKIKIDPEDVKIIKKSDKGSLFDIDGFGGIGSMDFFDRQGFNFRDMQSQMHDLLRNFGDGFESIDNFREFNLPKDIQRGREKSLDEFSREFDELNTEKRPTNKLELGKGNDTYIFKSDDGRPIVNEEKEIIIERSEEGANKEWSGMKDASSENQPIIYLNGKRFKGKLSDIDPDTIYSMRTEKGTHILREFGEEGKNGVMYIKTR